MRFLHLLIWDGLFYTVLCLSHFAGSRLTQTIPYTTTILITCLLCGAFLSYLTSFDVWTIVLVAVPALYFAFAPVWDMTLTVLINKLPLPFYLDLVPNVLLTDSFVTIRYGGGLVGSYVLSRYIIPGSV